MNKEREELTQERLKELLRYDPRGERFRAYVTTDGVFYELEAASEEFARYE
jgi:hypothetical protein